MLLGMAMGVGSAVGHQAVNAISGAMFGGKESAPAPAPVAQAAPRQPEATGPCAVDRNSLTQCLNSSNASNCDFYFTALQNCQSSNSL